MINLIGILSGNYVAEKSWLYMTSILFIIFNNYLSFKFYYEKSYGCGVNNFHISSIKFILSL